jgi:hypothetical protein
MGYEVYNAYRRQPGYLEFINKLNRIVNHMKELHNWYNNLYMTNQLNNNAYIQYSNLRQKGLEKILYWKKYMDFILMAVLLKDIIKINYGEQNIFVTKSFLRNKKIIMDIVKNFFYFPVFLFFYFFYFFIFFFILLQKCFLLGS